MRAHEFISESGLSLQVNELFQPGKKNWEWLFRGSQEAVAEFTVGDRVYRWQAFSESNKTKWEIQFRLIRKDTDPEELDLFGKTGTGNSTEVLSTAVDIARAFLQDYGLDKVEEITFNAKEDSRVGLYAKMIKRLLPDWDLRSKPDILNGGMVFYLTDRRAYDKPENKLGESDLRVDVPNEDWLNGKIEYARERPRDRHGVPYMGATTATVRAVRVPVDILKRLPGMKSEQSNVRQKDLDWLVNYMGTHNRLPPLRPESTDEYLPFINVAYNGEAWVNEGNHRIMAAAKLGWKDLPVEVSYFDGGERVKSGAMYPGKIGLGQVTENFADGKNPGRKGLSKRMGVNTKASVSSLRRTAKHSSGEKQRMAHWLANMKAGRAKAKKK